MGLAGEAATLGVAARSEAKMCGAAGDVGCGGTIAAPCGDKEAAGLDFVGNLVMAFVDDTGRGGGGAVANPERVTVFTMGSSSSEDMI